ncbi:hypothetical protein ACIOG4_37565 [Streptomyces microflavus]|uniref:hypothetical protein n=1 Tax=Streptomyces microflavus TaxID=1919 RepID=UPI00381D8AC5
MDMSTAALALYLSMRETGTLVTPHEAQQEHDGAVGRFGSERRLRAEACKRALFSAAAEPDAYVQRCDWARAAADFVTEP